MDVSESGQAGAQIEVQPGAVPPQAADYKCLPTDIWLAATTAITRWEDSAESADDLARDIFAIYSAWFHGKLL